MVDTSDGPNGRSWEEEMAITFTLIEQLNKLEPEQEYLEEDPPHRIYCNTCGKERTETRCLVHLAAKGCHYCHLQTNIHTPGKEGSGI